jgi:hypothetical protein
VVSGAALGRTAYLYLDEPSGYGVAGRRCKEALRTIGVPVTDVPFTPSPGWGLGYAPTEARRLPSADTVIAHLTPEYFPLVRAVYPGALLVGHMAWETDRLPAHWPTLLQVPDVLVVPCYWNAETIREAGVSTPVVVVPHVAAEAVPIRSDIWTGIPPDTTVVYTIAAWTARKAPWLTVAAYLQAFTRADPVMLVVKTGQLDLTRPEARPAGPAAEGTTAWAVARLLASSPSAPRVHLDTRQLLDADMAALHTRGDCYLSLCRAEGWGLGAFDAAAYANPVVITGYGGHLDYLEGGYAHLVRHQLVAVDDPAGWPSYAPDQQWAEPSVSHGAELLRQVVADPGGAAQRAGRLARRIQARYRPDVVGKAFRDGVTAAAPS